MRKAKSKIKVLLLFVSVFSASCIETKTFVKTSDDHLSRLGTPPTYYGAFSSFIYFNNEGNGVTSDSLTLLGNKLFDSIVKKNFKKVPKLQKDFLNDTLNGQRLALELINLIGFANENGSIRQYQPSSDILSKLTNDFQGDNFAFIVPAGYVRSPLNYSKERSKRPLDERKNIGISAGLAVASLLLSGGKTVFISYNTHKNKIKKYGSSCHLIVYSRDRNEIIFYRQQYFNGTIKPIDQKKVKKQLEYLLKEYL